MEEQEKYFLGLDLATKTGYAILDSSGKHITSGVWKFTLKADEDERHSLQAFRNQLSQIQKTYPQINAIFFEKVDFCVTMLAYRKHCMLVAVLELFSLDLNLPIIPVAVGTLKKYATGNGRADKKQMIDRAEKAFPDVEFQDDNHADAMLIAHWGTHYVQSGGKLQFDRGDDKPKIGGKGHKGNTTTKKKTRRRK